MSDIRFNELGMNKYKKIKTVVVLYGIGIFSNHQGICDESSSKSKIGPRLREILCREEFEQSFSHPYLFKRIDSEVAAEVFIRTSNPDALRRRGICVRTVAGDIVTALLPLSMVESTAALPSVSSVRAGSLCKMYLNESIPEIGVDHVWNGDLGTEYRGEEVIIGFCDSGIDWSHPDFIDSNGESRILFIWDQTDDTGSPPGGDFNYGTEYDSVQINNEIDGTPAGIVQSKDLWGHGSHVAGIAAGNGRGTGNDKPSGVYVGVAPKSHLIVVKGGDESLIPDTYIVDGINYIFQKAALLGLPAVVNLSLGTQDGPHDGTSDFERAIDNLIGWEEGRAVVVAAGNEGDKAIHALGEFGDQNQGDTINVDFQVIDNPPDTPDNLNFQVWYSPPEDLSIIVSTPGGVHVGPVSSGDVGNWPLFGQPMIYVDNALGDVQDNGDKKIYIQISDLVNNGEIDNFESGTWKLLLFGGWGRFDVWLYESTVGAYLTSKVDYSTILAEPGNSRLCITAGSYVSRTEWPSLWVDPWGPGDLTVGELSSFSSPGPTRPNSIDPQFRRKPEIIAPGEYILSSFSSDVENHPGDRYVATDSVHRAWKGTSMSAPHVTGTVALMLQIDPQLTSSEIKARIIQTARKDEFTGLEEWTWFRGYGKLDALEALRITSVKGEDLAKNPVSFTLAQNYPNPFNGMTVIEYTVPDGIIPGRQEVSLVIYDLKGRMVYTSVRGVQSTGRYEIFWEGNDEEGNRVSSGVYVYRLTVGDRILSRKMIYLR